MNLINGDKANKRAAAFGLRRRAIRLWGNTPHARKWLEAVGYLADDWVLLKVDPERLREQVKLLEESAKRQREQWGSKVRRIRP